MKQIKFRAWDKEEKKMFDVYAIDWGAKQVVVSCHSEDRKYYPNEEMGDKVVFMQFTGLKDKNGKEIYEGDIIKDYTSNSKWQVQWDEEDTGWASAPKYGEYHLVKSLEKEFEVIGNIYQK